MAEQPERDSEQVNRRRGSPGPSSVPKSPTASLTVSQGMCVRAGGCGVVEASRVTVTKGRRA